VLAKYIVSHKYYICIELVKLFTYSYLLKWVIFQWIICNHYESQYVVPLLYFSSYTSFQLHLVCWCWSSKGQFYVRRIGVWQAGKITEFYFILHIEDFDVKFVTIMSQRISVPTVELNFEKTNDLPHLYIEIFISLEVLSVFHWFCLFVY
jgi:hypothetical protein